MSILYKRPDTHRTRFDGAIFRFSPSSGFGFQIGRSAIGVTTMGSDRENPGAPNLNGPQYTRENEQLFPVDIDRLEQDCAAPSEQVVNNIVTG